MSPLRGRRSKKVQIKHSEQTDVPSFLHIGELAFSYKSGKLFIGPPDVIPPNDPNYDPDGPDIAAGNLPKGGPNVIELLQAQDATSLILTQTIDNGDIDHSPSGNAVYDALQNKVNKEFGKGLSEEDFTASLKSKLEGLKENYILTVKNKVGDTFTEIDEITFDEDLGLKLESISPGKIKVGIDGIFNRLKVAGQDELVPTSAEELEIVAGDGITITTDNTTNPKKLVIELSEDFVGRTSDNIITGNNIFNGKVTFEGEVGFQINPTVPNINIDNADDNSQDVVNIKSLKEFVTITASSIQASTSLVRFNFTVPSLQWLVNHNRGTTLFQEMIRDEEMNQMLAPIEVVDSNNFIVHLTEAMPGIVDVRF